MLRKEIFCPICAAENSLEQSYCRKCGQPLTGVQRALEGTAERSIEKLNSSRQLINAGTATLVVFTLIALAIMFLGWLLNTPVLSNIAFINLFLGLLIALPLMFVGKVKLHAAIRLLTKPQPSSELLTDAGQAGVELTGDSARVRFQPSVTEQTTLNLQKTRQPRKR